MTGYPNPTTGSVSIILQETSEVPASSDIVVLDQIGRSYNVSSEWDADKKVITLDFSDLQKGLYIIRVSSPANIKILKVFKE